MKFKIIFNPVGVVKKEGKAPILLLNPYGILLFFTNIL